MSTPEHSPLGRPTIYVDHYDPGLLFAIPRAPQRAEIGLHGALPFYGEDLWNAYELSWLDRLGKPRVAIAEIRVPADSPNMIESKSFKLYLNSFAQERFESAERLGETIRQDLAVVAGGPVVVTIREATVRLQVFGDLPGQLIDGLELAIDDYGPPHAAYLHVRLAAGEIEETLVSHLLRSNCPVTGQPDWGSVQIRYRGAAIDQAGLLRYLVSFRTHSEFHEQCVERIFVDLMARCAPQNLSVYARYTRRGGLDINPFRSSAPLDALLNARAARQ